MPSIASQTMCAARLTSVPFSSILRTRTRFGSPVSSNSSGDTAIQRLSARNVPKCNDTVWRVPSARR